MRINSELYPDPGSADFTVVHYETDLPDQTPDDLEHVYVANGYLEDSVSHHRTASGLISVAEQSQVPMRVTVHDSPLAGPKAYGFDYRTERADYVLRRGTQNGDIPSRLLGHSWAHPQWVAIGNRLLDEDKQIESVVTHNPNGLTPVVLSPANTARLVLAGIREARIAAEAADELARLSDIPMSKGLGQRALQHIKGNVLLAYSEGVDLLTRDYTPETAGLHKRLAEPDGVSRMRILAGSRDNICPSGVMRQNLVAAGYPESSFMEIDTFHSGPLADTRLTPLLYKSLMLEPSMDSEHV